MENFQHFLLDEKATAFEGLQKLNDLSSSIQTLLIVNENGRLKGTFTDGDIRRGLLSGYKLEENILKFCKETYFFLDETNLNLETIKRIREKRIQLVPYLNKEKKIVKVYDFTKIKTILPTDVVLMAGGRGERLRPLTDSIPKPLIKIGSKPIIEHNIDRLIEFGIQNIYISVKYLSEKIKEYFKDGSDKKINIFYIEEEKPLGTIGALRLVNHFHNENILIMNSDLFTNIDVEDFFINFTQENADMAIATIPYSVNIPFAILNSENNRIFSFSEKPTYDYQANAGIYLIKRKCVDSIPYNQFFNATDLIQALLDQGKKVTPYPIVGYWIDIGSHDDYRKALEIAKHLKV